jgi:hypothetical protein
MFLIGFPILFMVGVLFVVITVILAVPSLAVFLGIKGAKAIARRPTPTPILLDRLAQVANPSPFPTTAEFTTYYRDALLEAWRGKAPEKPLYDILIRTAGTLYAAEGFDPLIPAPRGDGPIEHGRYRDEIIAGTRTAQDAHHILGVMFDTITASYTELKKKLPPGAITTADAILSGDRAKPLFEVDLVDMVSRPGQAVSDMIKPFHEPSVLEFKLFQDMRYQLNRNLYEASGQRDGAPAHKLIHPYEHNGTPHEIVQKYLGYTPLQYVFDQKVSLPLTVEQRCSHWFVIGGSGHGKTTLLQHVVMHDIMQPDPPALFIIDSQGIMLEKIQRLKIWQDDPDRLTIIDPEKYTPALNVFDMANARTSSYLPLIREQVEGGIIELYNYIFSGLASELTSKQSVVFSFIVKLMMATPDATLHTLLALIEDPSKTFADSPFARYADRLDATARTFFENQFYNKQAFGVTRQGLARRLYAVLSVPAFDRMFSSTVNKFDVFKALQTPGSVTLVNTSKALLKNDASSLFGRFMIAQVMAATFERVAVAERDRNPAYLIVDEASDYWGGSDEALESLLSQARKYRLGCLFALQHLEQLSPALRSAVASNTLIKMAGGVSAFDANALAPNMGGSAAKELIMGMRKRATHTEFAAYVKNETDTAVRLDIPFGTLEGAPRMSTQEHRALIELNRRRYSAEAPQEPEPEVRLADIAEDIRPTTDF